jgi:hypothetical protein
MRWAERRNMRRTTMFLASVVAALLILLTSPASSAAIYTPMDKLLLIAPNPERNPVPPLLSGTTYLIQWGSPIDNYYNKKKFKVDETYNLYYSFNKRKWYPIASKLPYSRIEEHKIDQDDPNSEIVHEKIGEFLWTIPTTPNCSKCWVKVVGYDAKGKKADTDISTTYFTITKTLIDLKGNYSGTLTSGLGSKYLIQGSVDANNNIQFDILYPFGKGRLVGQLYLECGSISGLLIAYAPPGYVWPDGNTATKVEFAGIASSSGFSGTYSMQGDTGGFSVQKQ